MYIEVFCLLFFLPCAIMDNIHMRKRLQGTQIMQCAYENQEEKYHRNRELFISEHGCRFTFDAGSKVSYL